MKKSYLFFLLMLSSLSRVFAQDYNPFPGKWTWLFSFDAFPERSHDLQVDAVYDSGGDRVFRFNDIYRPNFLTLAQCGQPCGNLLTSDFWYGQDNLFGKTMIQKPGGEYQFIYSWGDTVLIKTQVPLGTPWNFYSDSTVTASITERKTGMIYGIPDSVLVITLSNGKTVELSKGHGILKTFCFRPWDFEEFPGPSDLHELTAQGVREQNWGVKPLGFWEIFDFQPGDFFQTHYHAGSETGSTYSAWENITILGKTVAADSSFVSYTALTSGKTHSVYRRSPPGETEYWKDRLDTITWKVSDMGVLDRFNSFEDYRFPFADNYFFCDWQTSTETCNFTGFSEAHAGRPVKKINDGYLKDTCGGFLDKRGEDGKVVTFVQGLGITSRHQVDYVNPGDSPFSSGTADFSLVYYMKGSESGGTLQYIDFPWLPKPPAADFFGIYPNPVTEGILSVKVEIPAHRKWQMIDPMGTVVLEGDTPETEIFSLDFSTLSNGCYILVMSEGISSANHANLRVVISGN